MKKLRNHNQQAAIVLIDNAIALLEGNSEAMLSIAALVTAKTELLQPKTDKPYIVINSSNCMVEGYVITDSTGNCFLDDCFSVITATNEVITINGWLLSNDDFEVTNR